jgi:hypothetical protein
LSFFGFRCNLLSETKKPPGEAVLSRVQQVGELLNLGNRVYKTAATKFVLSV